MSLKNFTLSNKKTIIISIIRILIALALMFYAVSYRNYILGIIAIIIAGLSISMNKS
ncbi:MAG: hypothetical protein RR942_01170 [Romboutsia sp.]